MDKLFLVVGTYGLDSEFYVLVYAKGLEEARSLAVDVASNPNICGCKFDNPNCSCLILEVREVPYKPGVIVMVDNLKHSDF